jgi:hypothetical protein
MHADQLNSAIAADAARLDSRYGRRGDFAVFQSPNRVNLFDLTDENQLDYASFVEFRALAHNALIAYTGVASDCVSVAGPKFWHGQCRKQTKKWREWATAGKQLQVTSSWVNIAGKTQRSINQMAHNHLVYGTTVTGVYYATSGWSSVDNATRIQLIRPTHLASRLTPTTLSIRPLPGTLLLFPTFLDHAADIHAGDQDRISVAFNARADE